MNIKVNKYTASCRTETKTFCLIVEVIRAVKNSFCPANYFVQCNGFFFFLIWIFAFKIKQTIFLKSEIEDFHSNHFSRWTREDQTKEKVYILCFFFLSFLRNIGIYRNPSISCLRRQGTSLLRMFTHFWNRFKRWKVYWLNQRWNMQGVLTVDEQCKKRKRKAEEIMESSSKEKPRNLQNILKATV